MLEVKSAVWQERNTLVYILSDGFFYLENSTLGGYIKQKTFDTDVV